MATAAIVLVAVAGALVAGQGQTPAEKRAAKRAELPPSRLDELVDSNIEQIEGSIVYLNDVKVEPGRAAGVAWVEGAQGTKMLVVAPGQDLDSEAKERVNVLGSVRRVPDASVMRSRWKLTRKEAKEVGKQGMYIEAERVK